MGGRERRKGGGGRERERQTDRERERDRQTDRQTERLTDDQAVLRKQYEDLFEITRTWVKSVYTASNNCKNELRALDQNGIS